MTTTDQAPPTNSQRRRASATVEPFDANAAAYQPTRGRRRPMLWALGVVLVALGVLGSVYLVNNAGDTQQVLAMRTAVSRGQTIEAADLTIAQISLDPAIKTVPAADRANIIGKTAVNDLAAGSLLTPDSAANQPFPPNGSSVVGIAFTPGQLPAVDLRPGDNVRVVATPRAQDDPTTTEAPASIRATVVDTRTGATANGSTVVDLQVSTSDGPTLAALAATQRIALILDSEQQ